jgi:hypothetical protein
LYYDDHADVGGGTAFVPGLTHTDSDPLHNGWLPDDSTIDEAEDPRPALYAAERQAQFRKGSLLLFQLGTWHRGTPVNPNKIRRVHHLCFRRADCTWVGGSEAFGQPTASSMASISGSNERHLIEILNEAQRGVLGL